MNTARKGNSAEVYVARWLQDRGWLVASRRHIGGAGDLLAVWPGFEKAERPDHSSLYLLPSATWLIEVKCAKNLWQQFRRADREAMRKTLLPPAGERHVVNVRGSGDKRELIWTPESAWP